MGTCDLEFKKMCLMRKKEEDKNAGGKVGSLEV